MDPKFRFTNFKFFSMAFTTFFVLHALIWGQRSSGALILS